MKVQYAAVTVFLGAMTAQGMAQTIYKCPKPDGTTMIQQMPCSPTGGGETMTVAPIKPIGDDSAGATARMKAYSESLNDQWAKQDAEQQSRTNTINQIDRVRTEELAKDCYAMEKRIRWIKRKEKEGAHLETDSVLDNDSKKAIEDYKTKCGPLL